VVGRGGELEAGSRSDRKAALSGTRLWLREGAAFVHRDGLSSYPKEALRKPCLCSEKRYTPEEQGALLLCCPRG
jgi:hypothetical protein